MPTPMVHLRLDADTQAMLAALAQQLGLTRSGVVRLALHQLSQACQQAPAAPTAADVAAQRRRPGGRPGPRPSRAYQRLQDAEP